MHRSPETAAPGLTAPKPQSSPQSQRGFWRRLPLIGRVIREVDEDINTLFWLLPVIVLGLVLAVQAWGLAALTLAALLVVPVLFGLFIAISWP